MSIWFTICQYVFIKIPCCQTAITRIMCCTVDNILQTTTRARPNLQSRCTTGVGPTEPPTEPASITSRSLGSFISNKKSHVCLGMEFFSILIHAHVRLQIFDNFSPLRKNNVLHSRLQLEQHLGSPNRSARLSHKTNSENELPRDFKTSFFFSPYKNGGN